MARVNFFFREKIELIEFFEENNHVDIDWEGFYSSLGGLDRNYHQYIYPLTCIKEVML